MNNKKIQNKKPKKREGPITNMKNDLQDFMKKYGITEIDFGGHKLKAKKK